MPDNDFVLLVQYLRDFALNGKVHFRLLLWQFFG